jgi:hypothetical protein
MYLIQQKRAYVECNVNFFSKYVVNYYVYNESSLSKSNYNFYTRKV